MVLRVMGNTLTTGTLNAALVQWFAVMLSVFINFLLTLIRAKPSNSSTGSWWKLTVFCRFNSPT